MIRNGEVFLQALGADAERLHPELRTQMGERAERRTAYGAFDVAGSRFRLLNVFARPVVGADAVVTSYEREVPFSIVMSASTNDRGRAVLDTRREFGFRRGSQRIVDRLTVSSRPGLVRNLLGASGRIELIEECGVTEDGFLRMTTKRVALRLRGRHFALRGILRVDVRVVDGWDAVERRRTIEMRATNPLVGTVLEYRGWYRLERTQGERTQ
ncbi:DUF4166 domain-containing protein [Microbacterium sp. ZW T5_45]|uniref:DUF4166 domain-containing protein n=1 Tax=Microbacterium sp. ZW T5_45 TaxID=3378080 RepID=UPI0038540395